MGQCSYWTGCPTGVGQVTIAHSSFHDLASGLYVYPHVVAGLTITDSTFTNITYAAIFSSVAASLERDTFTGVSGPAVQGTVDHVTGSQFATGGGTAMWLDGGELSGIALTGPNANHFTGPASAVVIKAQGATIGQGRQWEFNPASGATFMPNRVEVNGTLVLDAGSIVKVPANTTGILVNGGGAAIVAGVGAPVIFTGAADDSIGGDSDGNGVHEFPVADRVGTFLRFDAATSVGTISGAVFRFAGAAVSVGGLNLNVSIHQSDFVDNVSAISVDAIPDALSFLPCAPPFSSLVDATGNWFGPYGVPGISMHLSDILGWTSKLLPDQFSGPFGRASSILGYLTDKSFSTSANTVSWSLYQCILPTVPPLPITFPWFPELLVPLAGLPNYPDLPEPALINFPSSVPPIPYRAVSLGDSYASGEGNPPFDSGTDGYLIGNQCHRSASAWPRRLGVTASDHLACSGAVVDNIWNGGGNDTDPLSQLDRLAQMNPKPDIVFVTIGGNDLGFSDAIIHCFEFGLVQGSCYDSTKLATTMSQIQTLGTKLQTLYSVIKASSGGARVIVESYPRLFPASGPLVNCGWLDDTSRANIVAAGQALADQIAASAKAAGVEYVDLFNAITGHELCTSNSYMNPVVLTGGITAYSAHPTGQAQEAMAMLVQQYLAWDADPDGDGVKGYADSCPTTPANTTNGCVP